MSSRSGSRGSRLSSKFCAKRQIPSGKPLFPRRRSHGKIKFHCWHGAALDLEPAAVRAWSQRLLRSAYRSGAPKMSTLDGARQARLNTIDLFKSSLCQNGKWLKDTAVDLGVDAGAFQAVAALVPVPFLQACNRRWQQSISASWTEGYCPVCGAWPGFAEVRGIERSRFLRCGRCGGGWQAQCLSCPYCGMTDHEELVSLVPEKNGSNAVIDACKRCLGYVKTFTTLQGSAARQGHGR